MDSSQLAGVSELAGLEFDKGRKAFTGEGALAILVTNEYLWSETE